MSHFSAPQIRLGSKFHHKFGSPIFRSYGGKLPSSLTRDNSSTLGFSPHPPVSVYGTVTNFSPYVAFLVSMGLTTSLSKELAITSRS